MKKQWSIWIFVLAVIAVVLFAINYQGRQRAVPLSEIFPEENSGSESAKVEYEFVNETSSAPAQEKLVAEAADRAAAQSDNAAVATGPAAVAQKSTSTTAAVKAATTTAIASKATQDLLATPEAPAKLPRGKFTVQIASHNTLASAQSSLKQIKAAGYSAYIAKSEVKGKGTKYRIYVGNFSNKDEADEYLVKVRKDYKNSFVIAPRR